MESTTGKMLLFTNRTCLICCEGEDEHNLGILHNLQVFSVHYLCLLTGVDSYPSTPNEGLLGYVLGDIYSIYKKYLHRLCAYCKKCGASLECVSCKTMYHLPCGMKNGARVQMLGSFPSFCKNCADNIFPVDDNLKKLSCAICHDSAEDEKRLYRPQCCKSNLMIHLECLQLYAMVAGYLTRCPLCLNKNKFRPSVRKFGVFIPNSDAEWLIEQPEKFVSLPLRCCARVCIMKSRGEMSTVLNPCILCEEKIAHMECTLSGIFLCMACTKKLWPEVTELKLKTGETLNLSDTFPWLFPIIKTFKNESGLKILNKILKTLGEKLQFQEVVNWYEILDVNSNSLLVAKIKEIHEGAIRASSKGEPTLKKMKC